MKMKKYIKHMLFALKQIVFYCASALIPKDRDLWVFGAWQGKLYADNSRYLYEYVRKNDPSIRCVWLSYSDSVIEQIVSCGGEAYNIESAKAKWLLMRAKIAVQTEGNRDMGGFRLCRTKVVQLWHGIGPKKGDWNERGSALKKALKKAYDRCFIDDHANSYWMASSEKTKDVYHNLFGPSLDNIFVTGFPRNDIFVRENKQSDVYRSLEERYSDSYKIIYMPTHRNFGTEGTAFSEEQMLVVDAMLRKKNIVMVFKPHFHELKNYLQMEEEFSNIVLAKDAMYSNVYSYINDFDLLISDYSSIIFDFLCSHKPIVVFPFDMDKYAKTDAGLFDYFTEIPAGPFCYTWEEVINSADQLLHDDEWKEKREICRETFHTFEDGRNCERVYKEIKGLAKS